MHFGGREEGGLGVKDLRRSRVRKGVLGEYRENKRGSRIEHAFILFRPLRACCPDQKVNVQQQILPIAWHYRVIMGLGLG